MANDKQIVRKLTLKDANNVNVVYDIGALGENIKYDDNISINEKIDSVATDIQSVSGDITTLNNRVTEISGQITPATQHTTKSVGTAEGIHNLRYYESKLQYYNDSEWIDISGSSPEPTPGEYYMWEDATDEQIVNMIQRHYNEELDLTEIWSIGDVRTVSLGNDPTANAIETSGTYNGFQWQVGESHRMQNIELVIVDFNHDDLTTPISGPTKTFTKAIVTINQKNCLRDSTVTDNDGQNNHENGFMNQDSADIFNWNQCHRRAWCNGGYYKAIPQYLRDLIKSVNKLTYNRSIIETSSDYIFLLSEIEIFGSTNYSQAGEGIQYQHFQQLITNRYKMPAWSSSAISSAWWERSPVNNNATAFCAVGPVDGTSGYQDGVEYCGLAPAFCL